MTNPKDNLYTESNRVFFRLEKAATDEVIEWGGDPNLRTAAGIDWQRAKMFEATGGTMRQMAITEDTTTNQSDLTDLKTELAADGLSRTTVTVTSTTSDSKVTLSASFQYTGGSTVTVARASICSDLTDNDASHDSHFLLADVSPVAVMDSNDTLSIDWECNL